MDCARTALRLGGSEVTVFYRRTRAEMPAQPEEVRDLLAEGGRLQELAAPLRIRATRGRLEGLVMARMRLGTADESGRRRPEAVPGEEFEVDLDTLIVAVGQSPDLGVLGGVRAELTPAGYLAVDPATGRTSIPGIYAGGDIAGAGPASIVAAAGDGRRIAEAILARSQPRPEPVRQPGPWPVFDRVDLLRRRSRIEPRVEIPQRPPPARSDFSEVILTMTPEVGAAEAWRCLDCDLLCSTCEGVCPNRAIVTYTARPELLQLPRLIRDGDVVRVSGSASFRTGQGPQVAVLADLCNECGNCVTFCPTAGRPWRDKPRLYLDRAEFEAEPDNAFMLLRRGEARGLDARFAGATHRLWAGRVLHYSSPTLRLALDAATLEVETAVATGPAPGGELLDPVRLGTMLVLLSALAKSMPELPAVDADPD
jgi:putative selenate reductase